MGLPECGRGRTTNASESPVILNFGQPARHNMQKYLLLLAPSLYTQSVYRAANRVGQGRLTDTLNSSRILRDPTPVERAGA